MNFQFKLRNGKKGATIISELRFGKNIRIRLATSFIIPIQSIKYWDNNKQLIKLPNDILNGDQINKSLNEIRTKVYSEFSIYGQDKYLDKKALQEKLSLIINPVEVIEPIDTDLSKPNLVVDYFQWYINFYAEHMSPNTGRVLSKSTLKTYRNVLRFLRDYLESNNMKAFTFSDIDKEFYYDFVEHAQNLGYSKNYIGSIIQKLKTIIQAAFDEDVHSNGEFRKRYFRKFREEVNHPYLTNQEILSLYNLDIKNNYLNSIRDIFIIACYTGLRIGDLMSFLKRPKIEEFNGRKHIHIIQNKTKKPVFIPLKQIILDILEKRNGSFPHHIHQNLINREIKPLLRRCGVTELYDVEKTLGGKLVLVSKPKYQLISCHSARRSFCTNAYNSGMPLQDIMTFSGHGSEKMVLLYIKASAKEKAKRASDHVFFS
ncbi:MAG: site-specific integrase [Flavobacteriaceae bacterium]|nr:site-specific integrase [Flavobacteriaceae bacterium]